jgi:hypothetical protein
MRNKWTSGWDGNWFYCKVPAEQMADVQGKGHYPLSSTMTQLNYLTDAPFECDPKDMNVEAFAEVASIIGGRNTVEEFLGCGMWPLSEKFGFEVETKEIALLKVMVPMSKVTCDRTTLGRGSSPGST